MKYYEESNECSFEENNISYYNKTGIYFSEELDDDQNSCEFTSKASSNCNSCDELSSALDSDKLSQNIGDFLLYFENTTTALMFSWIQKNSIATNAYDELVEILYHPQFNLDHMVKNIQSLRYWRQKLPLMPIYSRPINISTMKTSSKSNKIKKRYYLSIKDII
ncbi:hypothetical protein F8M41_018365 [Gigaspora margarita]|uniref:Uncharacterized protein n=1 Tax=Gigaspora margarita TaxID=4874 RepID=A0A8H4ALM5_GIGMA|nr:hypothetical protein F8M41_018365 [Gigaspora margarita]